MLAQEEKLRTKLLWYAYSNYHKPVLPSWHWHKVYASHDRESESKQGQRIYVKNESSNVVKGKDGPREVKSVRYNDYNVGRTLSMRPFMISDDEVRIEFNYEESNFELADDESAPPTILDYEWSGRIVSRSGIPAIAGAAPNDNSVTFLILTATIQDLDDTVNK